MKTLMKTALVLVILTMVVETQAHVSEQESKSENHSSSSPLSPSIGIPSGQFICTGLKISGSLGTLNMHFL